MGEEGGKFKGGMKERIGDLVSTLYFSLYQRENYKVSIFARLNNFLPKKTVEALDVYMVPEIVIHVNC